MDGNYAERAMRKPRKCKVFGSVGKVEGWSSWYYVDHNGLAVYTHRPGMDAVVTKLTARQLRQALELIDSTPSDAKES